MLTHMPLDHFYANPKCQATTKADKKEYIFTSQPLSEYGNEQTAHKHCVRASRI